MTEKSSIDKILVDESYINDLSSLSYSEWHKKIDGDLGSLADINGKIEFYTPANQSLIPLYRDVKQYIFGSLGRGNYSLHKLTKGDVHQLYQVLAGNVESTFDGGYKYKRVA